MSGTWVSMYQAGPDKPDDPGLDSAFGDIAKCDALKSGYHPTDDNPSVTWVKDLITGRYAVRVVVPVTESEPL